MHLPQFSQLVALMAIVTPVLAATQDPGSPVSVFDFPKSPDRGGSSERRQKHYMGHPRVHARSDPGSPVSVFDFPKSPDRGGSSEKERKHYTGRPRGHYRVF
ncbi:hypothetical protein PgNI_11067 [Pyricularia grisea]|uniref:Uncharacterized protein n=1 Tax=Pyricularia grisea TaxID=148305 RepID=A0A6P8AZA2_PYRGI|nr:hypothetical protein PgNI_11067 [Pyricularia grisea]TLD07665.1 hypothetical protein PgNI_11067 [Pyricularia grisea]